MKNTPRKSFRNHPDRPDRRQFLAWNAGAFLLSLAGRFRLLERWFPHKSAAPGREARFYRRIE